MIYSSVFFLFVAIILYVAVFDKVKKIRKTKTGLIEIQKYIHKYIDYLYKMRGDIVKSIETNIQKTKTHNIHAHTKARLLKDNEKNEMVKTFLDEAIEGFENVGKEYDIQMEKRA